MEQNSAQVVFDGVGGTEDVLGDQTDRRVPQRGGGDVAAKVADPLFPIAVMGTAVAFDDEPPVDHVIHSTDAGNDHLYLDLRAEHA